MGDSGALPRFDLDFDLEDDSDRTPPRGTPVAAAAAVAAFGDAAFGDDGADGDLAAASEHAPPSTSRVFGTQGHPTRRCMGVVRDASARVVTGEALATLTAPPPPLELTVASRDGRVAAMRQLYAQGDAEGALLLAEDISDSMRPSALRATDHPDASIVVEFGAESSIDLRDPFGGLIPLYPLDPLDDELGVVARLDPPCAAPHLTLTERHSIPRSLKSMAEMSRLPIDHRAGFLLAHVDGMQTLEEILDVCAMPAAEALALFANLKAMGVIEFE